MSFLISLFMGTGLGAKAAKIASYIALALLAVGLFFGAKALYDRSIVKDHDAKVHLEVQTEGRKADGKAAEQRGADAGRRAQETAELERVTNEAPNADAARNAAYECLRLQRRARQDGVRPPACARP